MGKAQKVIIGCLTVILAALIAVSGVRLEKVPKEGNSTVGQEQVVIRVGTVAEASGTVDFICDGTDDNIQIQGALDALPANGGMIEILPGNYDFTNGTTVTRALANVTIKGSGRGTYITVDGATAVFTAGGNNWVFRDLRTDAGGLSMGATTGWIWENVTVNATYYTLRGPTDSNVTVGAVTDSGLTATRVTFAGAGGLLSDDADMTFSGSTLTATNVTVSTLLTADTGRAATVTVAASNSTATDIAQADFVADGVNDEVQIAAAIAALPTVSWTGFWDDGGTGATFTISSKTGTVRLAAGDYQIDSTMSVTNSFYQFQMIGYGAIIHNNQGGANHAFQFNINNNSRNLSFEGIAWIGNSYVATGAGDNVYITSSGGLYGEMIHGISFINVYNNRAGRYGIAVDSDNNTVGVRVIGSTFGELFPLTGQSTIRDGNKVHDIYARNVHHAAVSDSVFEGTGGSSIYLDSFTAEWSITGNQFHYLNAWNAALTLWTQTPVIRVVYGTNITITGNRIEAALHGIGIGTAASASSDIVITGNTISTSGATGQDIYLDNADNVTIVGNNLYNNNVNNAPIDLSRTTAGTGIIIHSNRIHTDQTTRHIINNNSSTNVNIKNNVHTGGNADYIYPMGEDLAIISGNTGSGAARRGEIRFGYASLTAGNANAIAFSWNNPETVEIFITKVVIEVRTGGGTVGSQLDVGIADDASGTNRGVEFFDDLLLNNVQINDSWVAGDGGTQTKWVFADDTAAAANDWIVGQILTQNAASLVGSVYIEYVIRQN